jgi:hypothetical protein
MSAPTGRHRMEDGSPGERTSEHGDDRIDDGLNDRIEELRLDHRHEVGMIWRGLIAFGFVLCVVWLRQRYFL